MESLWHATASVPSYPPLQTDETADVVIVGAGLTGLTAAVLLAREGRRVIVVEARRIGSGVTGGTTAHITAILDTRYHTIASDFGDDGAKLVADSQLAAIDQIGMLVRDYEIDCDYQRLPGYLYTEKQSDVEMLTQEYEAMKAAGLPVSMQAQPDLPFPIVQAIRVEDQAQFHPLKYLNALAQVATRLGCAIYEQSKVVKIEDNEDGVRVETEGGSVSAGAVFMATHVPPGLNVVDTQVAPYRSYVIACKTAGQYPDGLYWDTEDPYNYTRAYRHNGEQWLIVGGKDHKTGQNDDTNERFAALEAYAREHFAVESISYRWSAQVYEPVDGLGYIGLSPGANHYYYATGYSGNGMTYANVAARLVTDLILNHENPYQDVYSPARIKPVASAADYVRENVNVFSRLIGDRLKREANSFDDVAPGEGKVIRMEGKQIAVYRDADGTVHALSPVCPHMKCIVGWNTAEQTWDCPCHGGRFAADGTWLEGPPMHNLETLNLNQPEPGQD